MTNGAHTAGVSEFIDRKAGLVAFGIMQILFGIFCLLMVPLMIFGMYASSLRVGSATPMDAQMMIPGVLFYVILAVWAIWMGIGSIRARRWARALLLVTSWFWLISGILGLGFVLFLPSIYGQMGKTGQIPQHIAIVMKYVMTGFMVVFYVIIPGVFVLFYGSRNVKMTCERRNPHVCWTDKCPLPVLAVSLMTGLWCVFMPMMGIYGWPIPFFGTILTGMIGAGVGIALMVVLGYVALGFYKLNIRAWWCAVMMVIAWGVSSGITFSRVSMMDLYAKMNFPAQQLEMMKQVTGAMDPLMVPFCVLWMVIALAYLFYIKKYLSQPESSTSTVLPEMVDAVPPPQLPSSPQAGASSGGLAIASLVLGIIAVVLGIFVIGGLFGFLGLILGIIHLGSRRSHRSFAIWGVVLSIVGCLIAAAIVIFGVLMFKQHSSLPALTPQQRYEKAVIKLSNPATSELSRFYALDQAEKDAFSLGKRNEARAYAEEQSKMLERYKGDWNYGNAVQDINIVLGRIAVSEGKLDEAKEHLLKAGDSPGSPQMNSFGPNMSLAKDLLEKGEKQTVLEYFKRCAKFWKMDYGKLDSWARQVESGQIPEFGANLLY